MAYPPFEYGDHTADILIIANGSTLPEAFRNAALGVLNIMYDTDRVDKVEAVNVTVEGVDLEQLLFNWIDEVIYWFDGRKMAIGDIVINRFDEGGRIEAVLLGEHYDVNKHGFRGTIVKAMTYNMMRIDKVNDHYRVQFVVDI